MTTSEAERTSRRADALYSPAVARRDEFGEETAVAGASDNRPDDSINLLVMVAGGVQEFNLLPGCSPFSVGRSTTVDIHIDASSVSRRHANIVSADDGVFIQDLGSTNGTHVNGKPLGSEAVLIHVGDAIRFGDVVAQLRGMSASRVLSPRVIEGPEFDTRVAEEAERCVHYDRCLAVISAEVNPRTDNAVNSARAALFGSLRSLDVVSARTPGRFDVLLAECTKEEAADIAQRFQEALRTRGLHSKIGVAVYPGDVASGDSVLLAAQLAMHSLSESGIEIAREGARTMQIGGHEVVVAEPSMLRLFSLIERVAVGALPVLVTGETGSGKEIVAEAIHAFGPRSARPMVKLNCAAVPEQLLESELFGHERGAFSGAETAKPGLFEQADGSTMLLDEIGEMNSMLQAKLLRVLEDKRVRRVGATQERHIDARIVAATHRDLRAAVEAGTFRQDLYYRLSAMVLRIPPLRERRREIPILAERFAAEIAKQAGSRPVTISTAAMSALQNYDWPGNIRELRNVVGAAVVTCNDGEIAADALPTELGGAKFEVFAETPAIERTTETQSIGMTLEEELRTIERRRISEALSQCEGNQTQAAKLLGMPRRTLVRKLSALDIATKGRRTRT